MGIKEELAEVYPKVQSLFNLQRPEKKSAQLYYAFFLLRRIVLSAIIVFIQDHFFQIYALVFASLASLAYMISARPFTEPRLNRLETFNECIILLCCYHLLFFSEVNPDYPLKYQAGWSLDMLIIIQFIVNMFTEMLEWSERIKLLIRTAIKKYREHQSKTRKFSLQDFEKNKYAYHIEEQKIEVDQQGVQYDLKMKPKINKYTQQEEVKRPIGQFSPFKSSRNQIHLNDYIQEIRQINNRHTPSFGIGNNYLQSRIQSMNIWNNDLNLDNHLPYHIDEIKKSSYSLISAYEISKQRGLLNIQQ